MSSLTPSDRQTLTRRRHRFTIAFQGEISAFRESEEVRIARLVFPQVFNGVRSGQISSTPL